MRLSQHHSNRCWSLQPPLPTLQRELRATSIKTISRTAILLQAFYNIPQRTPVSLTPTVLLNNPNNLGIPRFNQDQVPGRKPSSFEYLIFQYIHTALSLLKPP